MADELSIQDIPPAAELLKRLSIVEKDAKDKVDALEKQVSSLKAELQTARIGPYTPVADLPCFAKYKTADNRIITSSVVKDTKEWYQTAFLLPHEPLRRDMIEVDYLLQEHVRDDEPWKLVNFFGWYESRFVPIVHTHHDGEEQIFFPAVRKRVNVPEKTSADHKMLLKLLNDVSGIGKTFKQSGGNATNVEASKKILPPLRTKWTELLTMMLPHLAEEEEQMITFIKDAFTEKEFDKLITTIIQHEGLGGAKKMLPSIMHSLTMWGDSKHQQDLQKQLPPPIRFMVNRFWRQSYEKYHRGPLNALRTGAPKTIIKESWF